MALNRMTRWLKKKRERDESILQGPKPVNPIVPPEPQRPRLVGNYPEYQED